jgi:alpha-tubulin suppressor-like RCC1 family protein
MGFSWWLSICALLVTALGCTSSSEVGRFNPPSGSDAGSEASVDAGEDAGKVEIAPLHTRIALGGSSTCAIDSTGTTHCWGDNYVGQLGIGSDTPESSFTPLAVSTLGYAARAVFGGAVAHCAVLDDGHVVCWGDSVFGEFRGRGAVHAIAYAPLDTPGLSSVAALGVGTYFHCALITDGRVKCYGLNSSGQLGSGSLADGFVPADVIELGPSTAISASQSGFFACAVTIAGAAKCWGSNARGQLGNDSGDDASAPVEVKGLQNGVTRVAAGRDHACAIANGKTYCWGDNSYNQLGDGSGTDRKTPTEVAGLPPLVEIAAGAAHTCGRTEDGAVHCWGSSESGNPPSGTLQVISSGVVEIAAGGHHSCAITADSTLRCWGDDSIGQLGPYSGPGAPL